MLHLQKNQLVGYFVTTCLETLICLEDLDLSNNQLISTILATISNVPLQNQLSLGHNLSAEIPNALGNLSLVLRIDLSVNNLTGAIPDSVGWLLSVQELNVSLNKFHGGIPMTLALLPSLVVLDTPWNHLGRLLPGFSGIKSLRVFDASDNSLTGPILNNFVDFSALQYLNNDLHSKVPIFMEHTDVNRKSFVHTEMCGVIIGVDCNPPPSDGHQSFGADNDKWTLNDKLHTKCQQVHILIFCKYYNWQIVLQLAFSVTTLLTLFTFNVVVCN